VYLRVYPNGAKVFYYVYRLGGRGSRQQWLKIGTFGDMPISQIRKAAQVYRARKNLGSDPSAQKKKAAVAGITIADVAKRFLEEYAPVRLSAKSIDDYTRAINIHILPKLGKIPIKDLNRETIAQWHLSKKNKDGNGHVAANRALATLSSICTQAEIWGLRPEGVNPCKHVARFNEAPRVRDIKQTELEAIGAAIIKSEKEGIHSIWALAAIKVIALCSGRVSEVLSLHVQCVLSFGSVQPPVNYRFCP
jgi:integrase